MLRQEFRILTWRCSSWIKTHSQKVWVARCNHVHKATTENLKCLTQTEKLSVIRKYLKLPRESLNREEKIPNLNISRGMKEAHNTTLAHRIHLLREVRADDIRKKSSNRPMNGAMRRITNYFKVVRSKWSKIIKVTTNFGWLIITLNDNDTSSHILRSLASLRQWSIFIADVVASYVYLVFYPPVLFISKSSIPRMWNYPFMPKTLIVIDVTGHLDVS